MLEVAVAVRLVYLKQEQSGALNLPLNNLFFRCCITFSELLQTHINATEKEGIRYICDNIFGAFGLVKVIYEKNSVDKQTVSRLLE